MLGGSTPAQLGAARFGHLSCDTLRRHYVQMLSNWGPYELEQGRRKVPRSPRKGASCILNIGPLACENPASPSWRKICAGLSARIPTTECAR